MEDIFDLIATIILFIVFFLLPIIARFLTLRRRDKVEKLKKEIGREHQIKKEKSRELGRKKRIQKVIDKTHLYEVNTSTAALGEIRHTDEYNEKKAVHYRELEDIHKKQLLNKPVEKGFTKINKLTDLQKAVVFKEILDNPRGLQSIFPHGDNPI